LDYTSSDVADAAERVTGRRAHMGGAIRLLAGTRVAGPAVTLHIVRDDSASLTAEGLATIRLVEAAPEGSVIVVAMDGDRDFAVFGTTFATLGLSRGLGGFVIEGAVRGLPALQRLGFPVFARGTVAGSAGGHYRIAGTNVPILGDADGVVVAPRERVTEILARARALRREKEELLPLITRFHSYTRAVGEYRRRRQGGS
jgi:regulator of RNase E activity RraA